MTFGLVCAYKLLTDSVIQAGVIKAILALEKAIIPPIAMFEKVNPAIDVADLQLAVRQSPSADWEKCSH